MTENQTSNETTMLLLGRIEGKLDAVVAKIEGLEKTHEKHDGRLGSLERSRATVMGWAAAVGAGASYLVSHFPLPR